MCGLLSCRRLVAKVHSLLQGSQCFWQFSVWRWIAYLKCLPSLRSPRGWLMQLGLFFFIFGLLFEPLKVNLWMRMQFRISFPVPLSVESGIPCLSPLPDSPCYLGGAIAGKECVYCSVWVFWFFSFAVWQRSCVSCSLSFALLFHRVGLFALFCKVLS